MLNICLVLAFDLNVYSNTHLRWPSRIRCYSGIFRDSLDCRTPWNQKWSWYKHGQSCSPIDVDGCMLRRLAHLKRKQSSLIIMLLPLLWITNVVTYKWNYDKTLLIFCNRKKWIFNHSCFSLSSLKTKKGTGIIFQTRSFRYNTSDLIFIGDQRALCVR